MIIKSNLKRYITMYNNLIALIAIAVVMTFFSKNFLSQQNIVNLIKQMAPIGVIACGVAIITINNSMDMSVSGTAALTSLIAAKMIPVTGDGFAVIIALLTGLFIGFVNAAIIDFVDGDKSTKFMITLGMMTFLDAIALIYSKGKEFNTNTTVFTYIGKTEIIGIPTSGIIFFSIIIIIQILLVKSSWGRKICMSGINPTALKISGISTKTITFSTYILSGGLAALGGILYAARLTTTNAATASGDEFTALAAVVIGGISINGGKGDMINAFIGIVILTVISNALNLLGVSSNWQFAVRGIIILGTLFLEIRKGR